MMAIWLVKGNISLYSVVLIHISLIIGNAELLFKCLSVICMSSLKKKVYVGILPNFWLVFFLILSCRHLEFWRYCCVNADLLIREFCKRLPMFVETTPCPRLGMIGITSATCSEMVQESLFRWEVVHSSEMVISRDENERPKIRWLGSFTEIWEFNNREGKGWRQCQGSFSGHLKEKTSLQPLEWAKYKMCRLIFCLHTIYM